MRIGVLGAVNDHPCPEGEIAFHEMCNGTATLSPAGQAACDQYYYKDQFGMLISRSIQPGAVMGNGPIEIQSGCQKLPVMTSHLLEQPVGVPPLVLIGGGILLFMFLWGSR